jgi:hypothetical protein
VFVHDLLPAGVSVYNASGTNDGVPFVQHNLPIPSNSAVNLTIEYYSPTRALPSSTLTAEVVSATPPPDPEGAPLVIDRFLMLANGNFLIDFSTISNRTYYIQYTSDFEVWKTATPSILGTGSRMQWIDNGPPKTESSPANGARFYRVLLAP